MTGDYTLNLTRAQHQAIYDANLAVGLGIGPFRTVIDSVGNPAINAAWYGVPGITGMQDLLIAMGNANAAAGLAVAPPADYEIWENTPYWDAFAVRYNASSSVAEANRLILARRGGGGIQTMYQGLVSHMIHLDDVVIYPEIMATGSKWGARCFNISGVWKNVEVTRMGLTNRDDDGNITYLNEGHAIYLNPIGTFDLIDANIHGNAGQAYQEATRPHLGSDAFSPRDGLTRIIRGAFKENGYYVDPMGGPTIAGGDRSSDPFSINGGGEAHDVTIESPVIETLEGTDFNYSGGIAASRGLCKLLADSWSQQRENLAYQNGVPADQGEPPWKQSGWAFGNVLVDGLQGRVRNSDRALFFIRGAKDAEIKNCLFSDEGRAGKIELDPEGMLAPKLKDGTSLQPCGSLRWHNNTGEGTVRYRGVEVGPIEGTYEFKDGVLV